ncbi:DUF2599 domain-containing protein [Streptomyces sp. NPDC001401]|uniref:DUF2599 domain-containing protein n=1 Tax=Streptomyces sp. NPDC001401 TaxID=3364570 RepID=UPI0036B7D9B5
MRLGVAIISAALMFASAPPALATGAGGTGDTDPAAAARIVRQIERVAPDVVGSTRIPVQRAAGRITAHGTSVSIGVPVDDAGQVQLSRRGTGPERRLSVALPLRGAPRPATVARNGTATYPNTAKATDLAVESFDRSVRITTVLRGNSAPSEFAYPVDVPAGGRLALTKGGGILVLDARGLPRGGFSAPWAKDATGRSVPTHYEVRGDTVVQVVPHDRSTSYPVVADPWLWIDLIDHADWQWSSDFSGWTLMVTPTGWARANAGGYLVGVAGWDELYDKYKDHGLDTNLGSMRNQYICHQQFVAIYSPNKPTWNLDEWRPDVGYWETVNQKCNPGGGPGEW